MFSPLLFFSWQSIPVPFVVSIEFFSCSLYPVVLKISCLTLLIEICITRIYWPIQSWRFCQKCLLKLVGLTSGCCPAKTNQNYSKGHNTSQPLNSLLLLVLHNQPLKVGHAQKAKFRDCLCGLKWHFPLIFDFFNCWCCRLFKEILEASHCNEICFYENGSWRPISDQGIYHAFVRNKVIP